MLFKALKEEGDKGMRYMLRCKAGNIPFASKKEYKDEGRGRILLLQDKSCAEKPYNLVVEAADLSEADCFLFDHDEEENIDTPCRIIGDINADGR